MSETEGRSMRLETIVPPPTTQSRLSKVFLSATEINSEILDSISIIQNPFRNLGYTVAHPNFLAYS